MELDDITLMLTLSLASLVGAAILGILSYMSRAVEGAKYWAIGLFLLSFAYGSHLFFQDMSFAVRANSHNLCLLLGHAFWLMGTYKFVGSPLSNQHKVWLIFPVIALTLSFTILWPKAEFRIAIVGAWLIWVRLNYAWILFQYARDNKIEKLAANIAATVALAEVCLSTIYTVYGSLGHLPFIGSQMNWVSSITWLGALMGITIGTPLLMLLSVGRLLEKLDFAAHHDELTELPNRRGFYARLLPLISIAKRNHQQVTVLMLDIDHFKSINDQYGHAIGDEVLKILAETLRSVLREADIAARWGGEEVCVLLHSVNIDSALNIANRTREIFSDACQSHPVLDEKVSLSIGIASRQLLGTDTFDTLQAEADDALYQAKNEGRDRVCVSDSDAAPNYGIAY
ncbi:GGDEF domain-containing protein [Pseudoteredinibacter isoporae]|uniref:diguanylate cyclase n=1 Tax=Pseudoteredinibacter isoporae TaxID=570281 RepID=A0A7X0JWX1_9GAMM|nr:GGDEF domain-containing protein [Pseudoteredinibacter isoporae]MBB6523193.1 diguanylate cyclase (GGDEF)-like protein [Pseudoteredinibacter isoporae]NHO88711.1 GGDEF domain-containing protein [Pseudoteredinibacter isoporae]NIB22598.1 GGDEF domain-containing protein [Pseudoteredinibacter isoporae]